MKLVLIFLCLVMIGCGTTPVKIQTQPIERVPLVLPEVDMYNHRNIEWIVITPDNAKEVFAALQKEGQPIAIIGLTGDSYEFLSLNTADQIKLIKQLQAVIDAYKAYYIAVEKKIDQTK